VHIQDNISLKDYNTFGIDVTAKHFVSVSALDELIAVLKLDQYQNKLILGGGSNMLLTKPVDALVIHINIKGKSVLSNQNNSVLIKAQAGENWHEFVLWTLEHNYGGLENMSLIPGNVGTAPIQNIGAYGVELKDHFVSCQALNLETLELETFTKHNCQFGYRNSIFKHGAKGKYIIVSVVFELTTTNHVLRTNYGAITSQLEAMHVVTPTIQTISLLIEHQNNFRKVKPWLFYRHF